MIYNIHNVVIHTSELSFIKYIFAEKVAEQLHLKNFGQSWKSYLTSVSQRQMRKGE